MKIKKLSIQGFKSFMDRLDIQFSPGISGIVGPNGCGKSNVVDAIRWCMGEQSPKQLRGRQMEDVIFSGSGDFKPMGMAEVSIMFENGNHTLPQPFSQNAELSVTRRLFRSGESEYRINNMPCRLKDIQEMFMDTGLGNRAYSIISQGRIGGILEQKPEDTRIMIEEAAGITKYRKKVSASQRKIELTETNLQRVEDIAQEIHKHMRSLKRQAGKAKRYKAIIQEIQELEITLHANAFCQLENHLENKAKTTEEIVRQEISLSTALSQQLARIEDLEMDLEEKDGRLAEIRGTYLRVQEHVHKKRAGFESLEKEMAMQEEMEGRLKDEQEEITRRVASLSDEKAAFQAALKDMIEKLGQIEEDIAIKEKRLRPRREQLKSIKDDYEQARNELSDGENKELGLTHESGYLNKMLGQITDSLSRLEKERDDTGARINTILKASEKKNATREAVLERLQAVEEAIAQQGQKIEKLEQQKLQVEGELKSAETDLNRCQTRLSSLRSLTENYEGFQMGVRTIMKAKDLGPRQKGHIFGLVADMIQVDPHYEQATESVLADKLQYIVVQSQEDSKEAIAYLKNKARGRGSFVPLQDIRENGNGRTYPRHLTRLRDCLTVEETFRSLIDALLEGTLVVDNLEEALATWKQYPGDFSLVTLDGDLVDRRGVITGGKLSLGSHSLLSRKREIKDLAKTARDLEKNRDRLEQTLQDKLSAIQEKKSHLERLDEDKWDCQEELNDLDKMLFRIGQELDQLEKLANKISEDLKRKNIEEVKHQKELSEIQDRLKHYQAKREQVKDYYEKKTLELKEAESEFEQFRDDLLKLKSDDRVAREEQRSVHREIQRLEEYVEESLERRNRIEEEIGSGQTRRQAFINRKQDLERELGKLTLELKDKEGRVNEADLERQSFQSMIREEEHKSDNMRTEINDLKDKINTAKMEHSEIRFKMDGLEQVVKEKFDLNLGHIHKQYIQDDFVQSEFEQNLAFKRNLLQKLGDVNLTAIKEHEALKERFEFIQGQREDLIQSIESLKSAIRRINKTSLEKFTQTFAEVDQKLKEIFPILFSGGTAGLRLIDESRPLESGVLVEVRPPGKKLVHMGLLSGGEKALVAMALLFAIYMIRPSPFCLLDEVDAPLDEANVDRFNKLLKEIRSRSQVIMVTHNRRTMEMTDRLYGITMQKAGISKIVSVDIGKMRAEETGPQETDQAFTVGPDPSGMPGDPSSDRPIVH